MPKHCQWSAESVTAEQHPPLALTSAQTVWCKLHCMHFHGWADDVLIWPMPGVLGFVKPANPQKTWLWWTCFTVKLFRETYANIIVSLEVLSGWVSLLLTLQSQIQFLMSISMHSVSAETGNNLVFAQMHGHSRGFNTVSAAWRHLSLLVMSLLWIHIVN